MLFFAEPTSAVAVAVPEPATLALMLGALAMLGRIRTRQYVGA